VNHSPTEMTLRERMARIDYLESAVTFL